MRRVVLVRPQGPRNVGMILRITQNFGPCELVLVAPERPSMLVHPEFEQMSHGAEEARGRIRVLPSLDEALSDCTWSVGFTARARGHRDRLDWRELQGRLVEPANSVEGTLALVFGNEENGLSSEETDRVAELAHIRTSEAHTSLNLAVTVGIVLSDLFTGTEIWQAERGGRMVNGEAREFLVRRMVEVFAGHVARSDLAAQEIRESIERVFARAPIENRDARAWHKMLRALGSHAIPPDWNLHPNRRRSRASEGEEAPEGSGEA